MKESKCHTLDRNDLRAQRDACGRGFNDEWQLAVDLQFNVTHWPYIQSSQNYECVQEFFEDSFTNLKVNQASALLAPLAASVFLLVTF